MEIACPFLSKIISGGEEIFSCYTSESNLIRPLNRWDVNEEVLKKYCKDGNNFKSCPRYGYAAAQIFNAQ